MALFHSQTRRHMIKNIVQCTYLIYMFILQVFQCFALTSNISFGSSLPKSTNFQSCWDGSFWVEPVLSSGFSVLLNDITQAFDMCLHCLPNNHMGLDVRKPVFGSLANKDADQPVITGGLISAFVFHLFESSISTLVTSEISLLLLVSVAKETSLSLTMGNLEDRFCRVEAHFYKSPAYGWLILKHTCPAFPVGLDVTSLAHLSRRLMGELIVYQSLQHPSVHLSTFSNIFSSKTTSETTEPIKLKFHMETS